MKLVILQTQLIINLENILIDMTLCTFNFKSVALK